MHPDPLFDLYASFYPQGWQCPVCKSIHSPLTLKCSCQELIILTFRTVIENPFFSFTFEEFEEIPEFAWGKYEGTRQAAIGSHLPHSHADLTLCVNSNV